MIFKVDFEKAYDSVHWDYLYDVLLNFGFGDKWREWIQSCLNSSKGSVIVNGSPTSEFQFQRGLKQGDSLSSFLFILIMESLHISFQRVVDAGMFSGIAMGTSWQLSHLFYADDAVFIGQWNYSNIDIIVKDDILNKLSTRLSKWKMKALSIGGRLTLLKSVQGSMPIYHISLFKVPVKVLQKMESIRCHFFNGVDQNGKRPIWVKWNNVLAPKQKGGLGVLSLYSLNRALLFKWVWRFHTKKASLWAKVIIASYKKDRKWVGYFLLAGCVEKGEVSKLAYPRIHALEIQKDITIAEKMSHEILGYSFRRNPRSGIEQTQSDNLLAHLEGVNLVDMRDRWSWSLDGSGEFSVASVRMLIDDHRLHNVSTKTRWTNIVPIKINVHAWKVKLDCLPTRFNISRRGMEIDSILCPFCDAAVESTSHIFFKCNIAKE
ncbi:RNA-directed DNA polymerase, eukaryota, reverse transcriptase zinc-binding domain protein, partial [Tanacetum coccineum]